MVTIHRPFDHRSRLVLDTDGAQNGVVVVDSAACARVAALLSQRPIPRPAEEIGPPDLGRLETGNYYLLLVSICHQTSPRGLPPLEGRVRGVHYKGWDYLSAKLVAAARQSAAILQPDAWAKLTARDLQLLFRDDELGDRLSDRAGRARLVRDLGRRMAANGWQWFDDLYAASDRRISGDGGLLRLLREFRAYRDPINKKSYLLLALMQYAGLWTYDDEQELGPPVDYHEIRGHLRIGTVHVLDVDLRQKLLHQILVTETEDLAIRGAVRDAIISIARMVSVTPMVLHYLFWNVLRSCCTHTSPHCEACPNNCPLPRRYVPLAIHESGPRRCPFSPVCASAHTITRLQEHVFDTDYY
jgi:hypothetical protein